MRSWDRTQIPKPFSRDRRSSIGPVDARRRRRRDPRRLEAARLAVEAALAEAVAGQPAGARASGGAVVIIYSSERFTHHLTPPGHPERPERAEVLARVAERWGRRGATAGRAAARRTPRR